MGALGVAETTCFLRLVAVTGLAMDVFPHISVAVAWLRTPNARFDGAMPFELCSSPKGYAAVEGELALARYTSR
jgi:uncharacterized protein (DUF2384 family)